jgi:DNA-binding NarL/FixJ family response regulator
MTNIVRAIGTGVSVYVLAEPQLYAESLGVTLALHPDIHVVGSHSDLRIGLADIRATKPAVVLLDRPQAEIDGVRVTRLLQSDCPGTKLVMLASATQSEDLLACVEAGVAGYISGDLNPQGLVVAIRRIHAGEALFPPELLLDLIKRAPDTPSRPDELTRVAQLSTRKREVEQLSMREREVLQALAEGLSMLEVSEELNITLHTVRTHLKNIMLKLHVRSKLDAVLRAIKDGLIVPPS